MISGFLLNTQVITRIYPVRLARKCQCGTGITVIECSGVCRDKWMHGERECSKNYSPKCRSEEEDGYVHLYLK
jgi:hypothetical protein